MIAIVNRSTVCTDAEIQNYARACSIQVNRDCAPAWGIPSVPVVFVAKDAPMPAGAWPILVFDDTDQQGALGWHSSGPNGGPYGRIFGATCKRMGVEVSTVVSHEVLEAFVDPYVNKYLSAWIVEVGDPVESDSYPINLVAPSPSGFIEDDETRQRTTAITNAPIVMVSDFTLPAFYASGSKGPWDFLNLTTGPFTLRPGGYAVTPNGTVYAEEYPDWKKWTKITDGSRTLRAIAAAAPHSEKLRAELVALDRAS